MANETLTRDEDLACVSATIDGKYRVGAVIGRSGGSTVCETELEGDDGAGVIKIREHGGEDSEGFLKRWRSAMDLAHPNLLTTYAVGSSMWNDVPIDYAVMERADESLEGVLQTRPLTGEEMREMLAPATAALQYLHKKGYAHSRLWPSNVMAVGELVKLSSDGVTRMSGGGSAEEDMRALGVLIVRALTRRASTQRQTNGPPGSVMDVPGEIPQPFRQIAQHCLHPDPATRWTAEQVLARLAMPDTVAPLPTHQFHAEKTPVHEAQVDSQPGEEIYEEEASGQDHSTRGFPVWIYAGLAALVVLVFLLAGLRKKGPAESAKVPAAVAEQVAPVVAAPTITGTAGRKGDGWSVIAAAYSTREPAEKRMREMAKRWPRFDLSVFQPQTGKTRFVVVLGQDLSEDEAEALRKRAVAAGLPRDTYIKKVM